DNGGKTFITNGDVADLILLFGKWSELGDGREAISALYLEKGTPGLTVLRKEDKLGHRASSTAALAFDNCRVPRANLLGAPGEGLPLLLAALDKSRPSVAAHALGIARAAFEDAVSYINERRQSGRRIVEFQGIQFLLADLATDLAMCESWLWHVARLVDAGEGDIGTEASMLKMRASDLAMRIATEAVQLHGGYGYIKEFRVERLLRDAKNVPPARVGRVAFASGNVAVYQLGQTDWTKATVNLPVASGNWFATDKDARAELRVGPDSVDLANNTELNFADLREGVMQIG